MKQLLTIFFLLLIIVVFSQTTIAEDTNCLAVVKLKYQILDFNTVKAIEFTLTNSKYNNIISYKSKEHVLIAYYTSDKNKWMCFEVPFSEETNDFEFFCPASNKGNLLVIKGVMSQSEYHGRSEHRTHNNIVLVINIDNEPTLVFKAIYGCDEAEIPYDGAKEIEYSFHTYQRKINVTHTEITISSPDNKVPFSETCRLSDITDGTYIFEGMGLRNEN